MSWLAKQRRDFLTCELDIGWIDYALSLASNDLARLFAFCGLKSCRLHWYFHTVLIRIADILTGETHLTEMTGKTAVRMHWW